jgi:ribosomal protein L31E
LYRKRRSFWQSAARLNQTAGVMKVITYNGVVTLRSQEQARQFGQKLFKHLSKGGKVVVTPDLIKKLFEERREAVTSDLAERVEHEHAIAHITSEQASSGIFDPHQVSDGCVACGSGGE